MKDPLKITVIGCGNANSYVNGNMSLLLTASDGETFLIDCGCRTPVSLHQAGIAPKAINNIYVSHPHGDHVGGLEEIALQRYNWRDKPQRYNDDPNNPYAIKLFGNEELLRDLWEHTLSGGLKTIEGVSAELETLFEPIPISKNEAFSWKGWDFELIQQIHVMVGTVIMPSYGLFMSYRNAGVLNDVNREHRKVFFTTDCQWHQPKQIERFYHDADIVIQDCECLGCNTKDRSYTFGSGVHSTYAEIAGWESANARRASAPDKKKIYLGHYQDFVSAGKDAFGNQCNWDALAEADGLAGFLKVGQEFLV